MIYQRQEVQEPRYRDYQEVGLWLKDNMSEGDLIVLEPLGYTGYYSQRTIHDIPGLVSPSIIDYRERHGYRSWLIAYLQDYNVDAVVLRPSERDRFLDDSDAEHFDSLYVPVFSVPTDGLIIYTRIPPEDSSSHSTNSVSETDDSRLLSLWNVGVNR